MHGWGFGRRIGQFFIVPVLTTVESGQPVKDSAQASFATARAVVVISVVAVAVAVAVGETRIPQESSLAAAYPSG